MYTRIAWHKKGHYLEDAEGCFFARWASHAAGRRDIRIEITASAKKKPQ